jgi:hypothetical protein
VDVSEHERPVHFHGIFECGARKEIALAFMGTATTGDVEADLNALANRTESAAEAGGGTGAVHAGIWARAKSVPLSTVASRLREGWTVILCGHSLGGAVAHLAASRLLSTELGTTPEEVCA